MRNLTASAVILGITALTLLSGCSERGEKQAAAKGAHTVTGVTLVTVAEESVPDFLDLVGTVKAKNSATIAARIAGNVSSVTVREGERVGKGQLLLTIEAAESTAGAAGAVAAVEEAGRGVEEAFARKRLAAATFERYQRLLKEQAVTRQEFETRQMELEVAAQGVARAEARLTQANEGSKAAGAVAGYAKITAPLSGIVTAKSAERGMTVFPGTPLVTVEEEGSYRLELAAPELLAGKVRPGTPLRIVIDGAPELKDGRVAEVVPSVDPQSRTFTVKVDLAGKGARSGMYGRVQFPVGAARGVVLPKRCVQERGSLTSVWVVDTNNIARMRLVKVGKSVGDRVEIIAGLSAGERIISGGGEKVVEGAKVQ